MPEVLQFPRSLEIPDAAARAEALDITRSFLVEAPAGSGKTALLIQRFLKLLAAVDDPAEVLAITFTRKATSELQDRVLKQLADAHANTPAAPGIDAATRPLALAVLAHDARLGWNLLDHPNRLNIRTIDGLSAQIANSLPLLSGGAAAPSDDPGPLYAEAARRTLLQLGGRNRPLHDALETLLLHRDGNLANCESLIAGMLAWRDQWGELVPLTSAALNDQYLDNTALPALDKALDRAICRALTRLEAILPASVLRQLTHLAAEMGELDGYKGAPSPIAICRGNRQSPAAKAAHLDHWRALIHLLVKPSKPRDWRKSLSGNHIGFEILKHHQTDLKQIVARLAEIPGLFDCLCQIDCLPPVEYPRENWEITKALFRVLARALVELKLVFADRNQSDFTEIALLAREALRYPAAMEDLAAANFRIQHLLVDEMQDTSTGQYEFLQLLTQHWDPSAQTVFLVGDPKQSIYLFRQARVERFVQTLTAANFAGLPLTVLRLTANFRSRPALVDAFNEDFSQIFPPEPDPAQPELVPFQPAAPVRSGPGSRNWHAALLACESDSQAVALQSVTHAGDIRDLILANPGKSVAVLVRTRTHLAPVIAALEQSPPIPYRAIDIKPLAERPEILDLLALTRALLHPADRTAWLALLRSPACGLSLADLYRLSGGGDETHAKSTIAQLFHDLGHDLSEDGIARLQPVFLALDQARKQRGRQPLSQWVQRAWTGLGFPAYSTPEALANAERYFQLLDAIAAQSEPGAPLSLAHLQAKMGDLYATPGTVSGAVDLMTLHAAKGLEWDIVIVPELHRRGRGNTGDLLQWLESNPEDLDDETIAAGILAPIAPKGRPAGLLNAWMLSIKNARDAAERKRLFYVACTRAREELHLFAAPKLKKDGSPSVPAGSLLHSAWPAAQPFFDPTQPTAEIIPFPGPQLLSLAASAPARFIQRIPHTAAHIIPEVEAGPTPPATFPRPEGSFAARAFGNAMHTFLQLLAESPNPEPRSWLPRISALLRAAGLPPSEIPRQTAEVLRGLTQTLADAEGRWLLAPHPQAASESTLASAETTIRLDRTFLAGPTPLSQGDTHLWIVDYKTATHGATDLEAFLAAEHEKYAPQLEAYASQLNVEKPGNLRLALYYPMLPKLIWWTPTA